MYMPRYRISSTHGMLIPAEEHRLAHLVSDRDPIRTQQDFLKLMAMSNNVSSRSQTLSKASNSHTEGASYRIVRTSRS